LGTSAAAATLVPFIFHNIFAPLLFWKSKVCLSVRVKSRRSDQGTGLGL
jgi:hypothetical protein